jgi:hypothetical protein
LDSHHTPFDGPFHAHAIVDRTSIDAHQLNDTVDKLNFVATFFFVDVFTRLADADEIRVVAC